MSCYKLHIIFYLYHINIISLYFCSLEANSQLDKHWILQWMACCVIVNLPSWYLESAVKRSQRKHFGRAPLHDNHRNVLNCAASLSIRNTIGYRATIWQYGFCLTRHGLHITTNSRILALLFFYWIFTIPFFNIAERPVVAIIHIFHNVLCVHGDFQL